MVADTKPDIVAATLACEEIRDSQKFAKLLELVLLVGNYLNSGTKNAQAVGFEISYLPKVKFLTLLTCKCNILITISNS